jgi:hypothetical protein
MIGMDVERLFQLGPELGAGIEVLIAEDMAGE